MNAFSRRSFLKSGALSLVAASVTPAHAALVEPKFRLVLNVGNIGVKASQVEAIKFARQFGYSAVTPNLGTLEKASSAELDEISNALRTAGLQWGSAPISPFFEPDETRFVERRAALQKSAKALSRAGVTRCMTWSGSSSNALTYRQNFELHTRRIREICKILEDASAPGAPLRFGLEYIGTKTIGSRNKFPFIRTLAEWRELQREVGATNFGLVLDAWHWWQAGDTGEDIASLAKGDVIHADLCDAPTDAPRERLPDSPRRLPGVTGVIDVKPFLEALVKIGYDGPLGTEPFNRSLGQRPAEEALTLSTDALRKSLRLLG